MRALVSLNGKLPSALAATLGVQAAPDLDVRVPLHFRAQRKDVISADALGGSGKEAIVKKPLRRSGGGALCAGCYRWFAW